VFQKLQALDTENNAAVKKILNAGQQKQFDAALASLPQRRGGFGGGRGRGPGGPGGPGAPGRPGPRPGGA
ncbi:MAG TPA: hypothetical protein VFU47_01695, partial [Armatimonadota bacterium]|nr:hypothetical protein [Armatimonadota bacterium]